MDQEHLLWITISSYYYFYLVYCLVVDKRLFREIRETDFRPIDEHVSMSETNTFGRGVMNGLFYFTLPVYLFLNRMHYYQARDEKGKRLHKHDFLYRYSVYVTFPLLMTWIMVYFAQDDMNEVINTVSNLYYTLVYWIPYFQLLFAVLSVYVYILVVHYVDKKVCGFYFVSYLMVIVLSLTFIIRTLIGFYFYFLESVPDELKIFSFYYGTVLALEKFLAWLILYMESHTYGNRLKRYCLYQRNRLLHSRMMWLFHSLRKYREHVWKLLRVCVISVLTLVVTSVSLSRILTFLFKRSFRHEIRHALSVFILYPTLFFLLPIVFFYIFSTDSTDSPIGSYLLIRKTEHETIYYSMSSLKILKGRKMLYRQRLLYLVDSWVDKQGVHYLCYQSVETGDFYYFIWQPHTNLLRVNGESPQEFIRDGTKDYIRNLAQNSVTSLEGSGFENQEQPKGEQEPFSWKKRTRKKLYKSLR